MKGIYMLTDCIVIGTGPAGLTASLYLARGGYKVICIGKEPGGTLNNITTLENYPGIISINGSDLANNMIEQCTNFGVQCEFFNSVKSISKSDNENYFVITLNDDNVLTSKTIIICSGLLPNTLNIPGEEECLNKISFCATCDAPFYTNKNVAIIGGGNTAMDFAISLSKYCKQIYIIHRRDKFRAEAAMINKVKSLNNIKFLMETSVKSLKKINDKIELNLSDSSTLEVNGIFYALGFSKNELNISNINDKSGIFFAGDYSNKHHQVITACGSGCDAALDCIEYLSLN